MSVKAEKQINHCNTNRNFGSTIENLCVKMSPIKEDEVKKEAPNISNAAPSSTSSGNDNNNRYCNTRNENSSSADTVSQKSSGSQDSNKTQVPTKKSPMDFRFGKIIGEGSYSTVYLAKDIHSNKEYAIKVCDKDHIIKEKKQIYVKREREALHLLNNVPGFVNLYCTFQDQTKLYFVMTYAKNFELLPYINKVGSFDIECTKFYAAELLLSIEEMHKRNIIHRDLKPENVLLDSEMHLMIADFGSVRILPKNYDYERHRRYIEKQQKEESEKDKNSEDYDETKMQRRYSNQSSTDSLERRNSFVGTAQYVTPEVLKATPPHWASDLWAFGCIIYQMIAGLPPFRGETDYAIFQKVLDLALEFPEGFDEDAKDLVKNLIQIEPRQRLGSKDPEDSRYKSIRNHKFFNGINWDELRTQKPPQICPYLPGNGREEDLRGEYTFNEEPGLGTKQLRRLLEMELGTSSVQKSSNILDIPQIEMNRKLEIQKKENPWISYVDDDELIVKFGFINKRKGLFSRKRMLLLTSKPRLIYIDAANNVKKGEIPFSEFLFCEAKNFKIFFVHTPNRTYYLEDSEGFGLEWCKQIEEIRNKAYDMT